MKNAQTTVSVPSLLESAPPEPRKRAPRELVGQSKACTRCGCEKDLSEFAIKRGGRAPLCRTCQKKASDAHYQRNKEARVAAAAVRNTAARAALTQVRDAFLAQNRQCACCGSTEKLRISRNEGYAGLSASQVISAGMAVKRLVTALENSTVRCTKCLSSFAPLRRPAVSQKGAPQLQATLPSSEIR